MIKVEAIDVFTLGRFNELSNIERAGSSESGKIFKGDKFECTKELADYLLGGNKYGKPYVKVIEVIPAIDEEKIVKKVYEENKPTKKKKKK